MKALCIAEVMAEERDALRREGEEEPLSALCISGGGVRSATFGWGVIQGLAERGLMRELDYLSTVSGGGFIGSFLTAWIKRAGADQVTERLASSSPSSNESSRDPIQHLRDYGSYLSPSAGALSTDLWTLLAGALRNVILNWLVLIPLLLAVLMLPRLYLALLTLSERVLGRLALTPEHSLLDALPDVYAAPELNAISHSWFVSIAVPLLSLVLFAMGLFNTLRYLPGVGGRQHTRRDYTLYVLCPSIGAVLAFLAFDSLYYLGDRDVARSGFGHVVLWTTIPCVAAWLLFLSFHRERFAQRLSPFRGPLPVAVVAMAAGTGVATWTIVNFVLPVVSWPVYVTVGPPAILLGFSLGTMIFTGLSSSVLKDDDREWLSRSSAGVLLACVAWAGLTGVVLVLPTVALAWRTWGAGVVGLGGMVSALLSRIPVGKAPNSNAEPRAERPILFMLVVRAAPLVFIALLAIALSVFTNALLVGLRRLAEVLVEAKGSFAWLPDAWTQSLLEATRHTGQHGERFGLVDHEGLLTTTSFGVLLLLTMTFLVLAWTMARYIDVNTFSLHGMYRDRLVRAYLGASNPDRRPNPFTDFDAKDDAKLAEFRGVRPFHIVNTTLNLVNSNRLAWRERKAASFTMTPLHCGSAEVGYRDSASYAGGVSFGTAVAISGAAASPNMGYYSSPLVGFIMTLFNARLGSWLGNPGPAGERTWKQAGPRSALRALLSEAAGATSSSSQYVYLSDGGHFENLGLYEIVRRRCRTVLVVDGGCDRELLLGDLGNALRKIRIDFGVPIDFLPGQLQALTERRARRAVATIRYSATDTEASDGLLVYVKPILLGTEPPDVRSYAAANPDFPHQSTADQSFDESQTESYRQLGVETIREVCGSFRVASLAELAEKLAAEEESSMRRPELAVPEEGDVIVSHVAQKSAQP